MVCLQAVCATRSLPTISLLSSGRQEPQFVPARTAHTPICSTLAALPLASAARMTFKPTPKQARYKRSWAPGCPWSTCLTGSRAALAHSRLRFRRSVLIFDPIAEPVPALPRTGRWYSPWAKAATRSDATRFIKIFGESHGLPTRQRRVYATRLARLVARRTVILCHSLQPRAPTTFPRGIIGGARASRKPR